MITVDATQARKFEQAVKAMKIANDGRGSDDETEAALAMAASLMMRYNLDAEEVRRAAASDAGEVAQDELIVTWFLEINTLGGHAPHRIMAFHTVVAAMGAEAYFTRQRRGVQGYRGTTLLHVVGHAGIVESLKVFLPIMELQMERLSSQAGKNATRVARQRGTLRSNTGCHARRGYMRGFGAGIASRIQRSQVDTLKTEDATGSKALVIRDRATQLAAYMTSNVGKLREAKTQKYDANAFREGWTAGTTFASPTLDGNERDAVTA